MLGGNSSPLQLNHNRRKKMPKFRPYIVEFLGKTIKDENIKIRVGAGTKDAAIHAAIKKHNAINKHQVSEKDFVRTHCSNLKSPTGQILNSYSAR
jgi:hypothetical protein